MDSDFSIDENDELKSDGEDDEPKRKRKGVDTKAYKVSGIYAELRELLLSTMTHKAKIVILSKPESFVLLQLFEQLLQTVFNT